MNIRQVNSERRAFGVHPGIIITLMREQAGSLDKALAELVMNSVDAGASRIDITIDGNGFTISDDGRGFVSRDQLENFFEIFGTPHNANDAYYGKFRIGRGQIMSYARTVWRSGVFEMRVDIANSDEDLGYDLITHTESQQGCCIRGEFYQPESFLTQWFDPSTGCSDSSTNLIQIIRYVPIPVAINGKQVNQIPSEQKWDLEDDVAWYRFNKSYQYMMFYNRGIHTEDQDAARFGTGGIVVTKVPLKVNLARNSIITSQCETWEHATKLIQERFTLRLAKAKNLDPAEASRLFWTLLFDTVFFDYEEIKNIRRIKFMPDIFGTLQSPEAFLSTHRYTLYDGQHSMIAERVQSQGLASVIVPHIFHLARLESSEANLIAALTRLRFRLHFRGTIDFVPFSNFVSDLSDTHHILPDTELKQEELLVLNILRKQNSSIAAMFTGDQKNRRRLVAGVADDIQAWTDGSSFIAIHRDELIGIRGRGFGGGVARLLHLLAHEYSHTENSIGNHGHDIDFYRRHHAYTMKYGFGHLADLIYRNYVAAISKLAIVPSADVGYHVRQLASYVPSLTTRKTRSLKENTHDLS